MLDRDRVVPMFRSCMYWVQSSTSEKRSCLLCRAARPPFLPASARCDDESELEVFDRCDLLFKRYRVVLLTPSRMASGVRRHMLPFFWSPPDASSTFWKACFRQYC